MATKKHKTERKNVAQTYEKQYNSAPNSVKKIIDSAIGTKDNLTYLQLKVLNAKLNKNGWEIDYGLDGGIISLTKMSKKTNQHNIEIGDHILITDRTSKFKTKYATVKKVLSKKYIVTVDDAGTNRDVVITKKGALLSEKPKTEIKPEKSTVVLETEKAIKEAISKNKIKELYDEYEDENLHSQNALLVAHVAGNSEDILEAETILNEHEKSDNGIPYEAKKKRDSLIYRLGDKFDEIVYGKTEKEHATGVKNKNELDLEILEVEVAEITKQIDALEEKRYALEEQITKLKVKKMLNETPSFMPWQRSLSGTEVEFIIQAINKYGHGEKQTATIENWHSFKFDYIKNILESLPENALSDAGKEVKSSVLSKFNVK